MRVQDGKAALLVDLALLVAGFLLLNHRFLDPAVTFPAGGFTDLRILSQASYVFTGKSLLEGQIPWWNPYWFAGYPHFEMPESAVFYPTTFLYGVLGFAPMVKLDLLGHLLLFAIGGYLLGRDLFAARLPALCLGFLLMAGHTGISPLVGGRIWSAHSWCWVPLGWLFLRRTLTRRGEAWALALAAVITLQAFAGAPQNLSYELIALGSYAALELVRRRVELRQPWPMLGRKAAACLGGVALGLAMAAVTLLSSEHLLAHSIRAHGVTLEYFRGEIELPMSVFLDMALLRDSAPQIASGALSLALLCYGMLRGRGGERFVFAGVAGLCIFYAFLPDWAWESVVRHLPGLGGGRVNLRILPFVQLTVAVLAAGGLSALISAREAGRSPRREWSLLALLGGACAVVPFFEQPELAAPLSALVLGLAGLAGVVWLRSDALHWAPLGVALLLLVEGAHLHARQIRYGETRFLAVNPDFRAFSERKPGLDRAALFRPGNAALNLHRNLGSLTGDRVLGGYHALMLDDYATFMKELTDPGLFETDAAGRLRKQRTGTRPDDWLDEDGLASLDLLNVRWLVSRGLELAVPERQRAGADPGGGRRGFTKRRIGKLTIYENLDALPIAYVVHRAEVFESQSAARARLRAADFDPRDSVVLTAPFDTARLAPAAGPETVQVLDYDLSHVELAARLSAPGIVVLTDVFHPGWRVSVDGSRAELLRVNTLVRGVLVPAGRHRVRFDYRPARLVAGASVSAVAWAAWAAGLAVVWRRRSG